MNDKTVEDALGFAIRAPGMNISHVVFIDVSGLPRDEQYLVHDEVRYRWSLLETTIEDYEIRATSIAESLGRKVWLEAVDSDPRNLGS